MSANMFFSKAGAEFKGKGVIDLYRENILLVSLVFGFCGVMFFLAMKSGRREETARKAKRQYELNREVFLVKPSSIKQHVIKVTDGFIVRPTEGRQGDMNKETIDYNKYKGPYTDTNRESHLEIRKSERGIASWEPHTVMNLFQKAGRRAPQATALVSHDGKRTWTWAEYVAEARMLGRALIHLGMRKGGCVNIIGFNCPEWLLLNMGAIAGSGMAAGVYTSNGPDACEYQASHSEAVLVACESAEQMMKYAKGAKRLTHLKAICVWDPAFEPAKYRDAFPPTIELLTFPRLKALGEKVPESELDARIKAQTPSDPCTLIYTSGTTGNPKAVIITNDNCTWEGLLMASLLFGGDDLSSQPENTVRMVSYLPLSHIAAQMLDVHAPIFTTGLCEAPMSVHFADSNALKGTLALTLAKVRPTFFFGVPRVFEKFQAVMMAKAKENSPLKRRIAAWAKAKGLEWAHNMENGGSRRAPSMWWLANRIIVSIQEKIGLDRCRVVFCGAAPINMSTLEFFASLKLPIMEVYGMSESTGATTMSHIHGGGWKLGSCGQPGVGTELRILHDPTRDRPGQGEICYRGRHIMAGYLGEEKKTREAIDEQGWLHSGDVGRVDENGMLYITGRIKELLISAGGENVPPVPIEERLKSSLPACSNIVMIGDKRKFFVALVTPKCVPNPDGTFSSRLDAEALKVDPAVTDASGVPKSQRWVAYVQAALDDYNKNHAFSGAQKITKFTLLPSDFSVPGGELGPTLKLRRNIVNEKYAKEIESLYPPE